MANPTNFRSLDGDTGTPVGDSYRSRGHYHGTVFVAVAGDASNVELDLEVSPDEEHWDDTQSLSGADFSTDADSGDDTASIGWTGQYFEHIRMNVQANPDDVAITAWIMVGGNSGSGTYGIPERLGD